MYILVKSLHLNGQLKIKGSLLFQTGFILKS